MTGPEHRRKAERLIEPGENAHLAAPDLAEAQVHATLAVAAGLADLFALFRARKDDR